jgi:hypothetical protein
MRSRLKQFKRIIHNSEEGMLMRACLAVLADGTTRLVEGDLSGSLTNAMDSLNRAIALRRVVSFEIESSIPGERHTIGIIPVHGHAILLERKRRVSKDEAGRSFDLTTFQLRSCQKLFKESLLVHTHTPQKTGNRLAQYERESAAFDILLPTLLDTMRGKWVAVREAKTVDQDLDEFELARRVEKNFPGQFVLIRQVTDQQFESIQLESPEFDML